MRLGETRLIQGFPLLERLFIVEESDVVRGFLRDAFQNLFKNSFNIPVNDFLQVVRQNFHPFYVLTRVRYHFDTLVCLDGTGHILNLGQQNISADKIFGTVRDFQHFSPQKSF